MDTLTRFAFVLLGAWVAMGGNLFAGLFVRLARPLEGDILWAERAGFFGLGALALGAGIGGLLLVYRATRDRRWILGVAIGSVAAAALFHATIWRPGFTS